MSSLERTVVGDVHVITVKKNLVGGDETSEMTGAIESIAATDNPKIVVDLSKISHLTSTGLGALVQANTHCLNRGGWLRISGAGSRIKNVFLITKLVFVFDTYESVKDAVQGTHEGG